MNRAELQRALDEAGVHPAIYNLDGRWIKDATHVLEQTDDGWTVYFFERGIRSARETYATEAEACDDLWGRLAWDRKNAAAKRGTELAEAEPTPPPARRSWWPWRRN